MQLNTAILSFQHWFWLASSEFALCLVLYLRPLASAELARTLICPFRHVKAKDIVFGSLLPAPPKRCLADQIIILCRYVIYACPDWPIRLHSATLICGDMDPARFAAHPAVVVIVILVLFDICLHKLETSGCEGNLCSPEVSGD